MTKDSAIHSLVFGFGHRARHGKDTVAGAIKQFRGMQAAEPRYDIRIYSFGKELKGEVNALYERAEKEIRKGIPSDNIWASVFLNLRCVGIPLPDGSRLLTPEWVQQEVDPDMTDPLCPYGKQRTLLQWWGSEYRRIHNGENYWVERVAARLKDERPEIALISDLRFPNEMIFVKEYGLAIKVQRPGLSSPNAHISEEALAHVPDNEWDAIITNEGSLEDLKAIAVWTFDDIMAKQR